MNNSSVFKVIGKYLYDKRKQFLINKIEKNKFKHFYQKIEIKNIDFLLRKDVDIIKLLIDKYDMEFINQYSEKDKESDFFIEILEHAKNKESEWHLFNLLKIPTSKKFEKYQIIQKLLNKELILFSNIKEEYRKDPFIFYECLKQDKSLLDNLSKEDFENFKDSETVCYEILTKRRELYRYCSDRVKSNKHLVVNSIIDSVENYQYIPDSCKLDRELVLKMLGYNIELFPLISDKFKNDVEFIISAVKKNCRILEYADKTLLPNSFWVLNVIDNPLLFEYAPEHIKDMYSTAKIVIEKNPSMYEYLSKNLKNKRDLALMGVKKNGAILATLSAELRDDFEIVLAACNDSIFVYQYASKELKNNKDLILEILDNNRDKNVSFIFNHMNENLLKEYDILLAMAYNSLLSVDKLSDELKKDKNLKKKILQKNPSEVYNYAYYHKLDELNNKDAQERQEFILEAIIANPVTIKYLEEEWKDKDFYINYETVIILNKESLQDDYELLKRYQRENELNENLSKQDSILGKASQIKSNVRKKV